LHSIDSLYSDRLTCDHCGHSLAVPLDPWDDPESLRMLTDEEAAPYWPTRALGLLAHAMACPGGWFGHTAADWEEMSTPDGHCWPDGREP
jgi:hypothetical protein